MRTRGQGSRRGTQRGSAPPRLEEPRLSLLRRQGSGDHRSREARADRPAADPAGLARRLDRGQGRARSCRQSGSTVRGASSTSTRPRSARSRSRRSTTSSCASASGCLRSALRWPTTWTASTSTAQRVCAIALRLINLGWFRPGSERYAKESRTYGITTLRKRHVTVRGSRIALNFRGKHKVWVRTAVLDAELADALKELIELRGGRGLFRYRGEDGELVSLTDRHLNQYVQEHMGDDFTVKDFRTWGGTLLAAIGLAEHGIVESESQAKKNVTAVCRQRRGEAREHARRLPRLLHQPARDRAVPRRAHHRRFPAAAFARRLRTGYRARSRRAGAPQPASLVANSAGPRGRVVPPRFVG